jgi:hypothetical protein
MNYNYKTGLVVMNL